MKISLSIVAALLFQAGTFPSISNAPAPIAQPQHLRYVRSLTVPPKQIRSALQDLRSGAAAVLDRGWEV